MAANAVVSLELQIPSGKMKPKPVTQSFVKNRTER